MCLLFWITLYLSEETFEVASRRLCNMTYVIWQVCLNLTDLILFYIVDRLLVTYEYNYMIEAINYNQLFYFFFVTSIVNYVQSSLMTGLVNLLIWTLYETEMNSYYYCFIYLYGVGAITTALKGLKLRIKI